MCAPVFTEPPWASSENITHPRRRNDSRPPPDPARALGLTRLLGGLVFGISTRDLGVFALVPVVLLDVTAIAVYFPARRAASVDPLEALR